MEPPINDIIKHEIGMYEEYTSRNGISMIKGIHYNWMKVFKYYDNTGPWSLCITIGSFEDLKYVSWELNEDKHLIFTPGLKFHCDTILEAETFITKYLKANKLEIAPLYKK